MKYSAEKEKRMVKYKRLAMKRVLNCRAQGRSKFTPSTRVPMCSLRSVLAVESSCCLVRRYLKQKTITPTSAGYKG